jgi:DNA polymerase III subunit delta'
MTMGALLPWQEKNWRQLRDYIDQNRVPQALLITGRAGIGIDKLAKQLAFSLLCSARTTDGLHCGNCRSCLLVAAGNHPDFIEIAPEEEKKVIAIAQIRGVIADTALMPQYEEFRVVVINPADLLNTAACNAFLKCLEEPSARTVFILVSDRPVKLPATIRSRCQKLLVVAPDAKQLAAWYAENRPGEIPKTVVQLFNSGVLAYDQLLNDALLNTRIDCFQDWQAIAKMRSYPAIVAEKWDNLPKNDLLNWLLSWVADSIKYQYCENAILCANPDLSVDLQKLSAKLNLKALYALYDKILLCKQQIDGQLNFQNMLEDLLVSWQEKNRSSVHG